MKLKRAKIYGFKTFADKTEFDFDGDIIAIIGPNGCGKSNIVDAVLWGLGETNARQLRAQTAKEVIFSGSRSRKPVGYAEVTLTFDNEDGSLPVDTPEVSVTRRLTRAGDSDFAINKRPCRLRDVSDLLADSGLGRAGYAIVSQSDIDQALSASAAQRRAWIDEAAGVQRYRARRVESLRRLDHAQENLARVHDIITEIESQRAPLAAEAQTAKQYKTALSALREVESGLLARELADALRDIAETEARIAATMKEAETEAARADDLERRATQTQEAAARLESRADALRQAQQAAQAKVEQTNADLQIARHKLGHLDTVEANLAEESTTAAERLTLARTDLETARQEEVADREALANLETDLAGAGDGVRELRQAIAALDQEIDQARQLLAERHKQELEQAHQQTRRRQVKTELQGILDTLPDLEAGLAEAETQLSQLAARLAQAAQDLKTAENHILTLKKQEDARSAETRQILAQIASLDGRRRGVEATIEAHEGLAQGPRAVMLAVQAGKLSRDFLPVGEAIDVDPDLANAFDTALGAAANDLIVPDERHAKSAIQFLKDHRAGRATFQPVNLMRPSGPTPELRELLRKPGVVGLASELARCESAHRPVVDSLLGRVVLVQDLDTALALARTRGWSRLVTLEGEVVHSSGAVSGGASQRASTGIVQRRAELTELESQIQALQEQLSTQERQSRSFQDNLAEAQTARDNAREIQTNLQSEHDDARSWAMSLRHEHTTTVAAQKRLKAEIAKLAPGANPLPKVQDIAEIEARRDAALRQLAAKSSDADTAQTRLQEARERLAAASRRRADAERRLAHVQDVEANRLRRADHIGPEREKLQAQAREAASALAESEAEVTSLREQVLLAIEAKKNLGEEATRLAETARAAQKAAQSHAETLHHAELLRARADGKRSAALGRLLEEYGVNQEEAVAQAHTVELPEDAPALVAKLRREIKAMGDVNLGAIEAYERLTERHTELAGQTEDIETAIREIKSTVRELDHLTRERFVTTFDQLREAFRHTFVKLLGGGEAELELAEAENILDSGVDISVTIPGKKRQRLELLSGGERAMSAIAFLFSLLQVKPSPLVVLDEVDAPLDGRNVERFIAMLRDFTARTQFVVITHNPVTIESADVWFGVTMQEPGVSTLVPYKVGAPAGQNAPSPEIVQAVVPAAYLKG